MTTSDLPTGTAPRHREVDEDEASPPEPNYLLRRAIVIGSIVALIAAVAIGVGMLLERDGDTVDSGAAQADWNTVVLLDGRTGQVILTDGSGAESARFASGVRSPTDAMAVGSTLLVSAADATAVVDLATESSQIFDFAPTTAGVVMAAGQRGNVAGRFECRRTRDPGPRSVGRSHRHGGIDADRRRGVRRGELGRHAIGPRRARDRHRQLPERAVLVRPR